MSFRFGSKSLEELEGVHPLLVETVKLALSLSASDFSVFEGVRSQTRQELLYKQGKSTLNGVTSKSQHQVKADGFGHAVDLVPYINGSLQWKWPQIFDVAEAMRQASEETQSRIRWGGSWQVITGTTAPVSVLRGQYAQARKRQGRRVFLDGPHFELRTK